MIIHENAVIKIGRVVALHPEDNTVDVVIIDRFDHKINDQLVHKIEGSSYIGDAICAELRYQYGERINNVSIRMTTDEYYFTGEGAYNINAWKMFIPSMSLRELYSPIYVNVVIGAEESFIISCFKDNNREISIISTDYGNIQLSRRLFHTYNVYAHVRDVDHNHYFYDLDSGTEVCILTSDEFKSIHRAIVYFSIIHTSYYQFPNYTRAIVDAVTLYGDCPTCTVLDTQDTNSGWVLDPLPIGSTFTTTGIVCPSATYISAAEPSGDYVSEVTIPCISKSPNIIHCDNCTVDLYVNGITTRYELSSYERSTSIAGVSFTMEATVITLPDGNTYTGNSPTPSILSCSQIASILLDNSYQCYGRMSSYYPGDSSSSDRHVAYIFTKTPGKPLGRDSLLEAYLNSLCGTVDVSNVGVDLIAKPVGLLGTRFNESFNITSMI